MSAKYGYTKSGKKKLAPGQYKRLTDALSANPGFLHKELGVPMGKKIPIRKLERASRSEDLHVARAARLAITARSFDHHN